LSVFSIDLYVLMSLILFDYDFIEPISLVLLDWCIFCLF